jgi:nitrogen regulatory protein PII
MKFIEAYIPPDALDEVRTLLRARGIEDLVASEMALETGEHERRYRESATANLIPQLKLELAVPDDQASSTAHDIFKAVRTRRAKRRVQILISPLEDVVRIETGQHGSAAL